jgi:HAD superfamily phosphatase (TIGR01668 family)
LRLEGLLRPEGVASSVAEVDVEGLRARGKSAIILDVDNTVAPRDLSPPPDDVIYWIESAKAEGFALCFVSNNWHRDVLRWSRMFELPIVHKAMKPLPFAFRRALALMGTSAPAAAVIGDQLMTDVLGAHLAGIGHAVIVAPLSERDLPHTLLLRRLEALALRRRRPAA